MHDVSQDEAIARVESALHAMRNGRMVVVVDDDDRENEGDLIIAAEFADARAINFMATHGRGLICLALTEQRASDLRLADQRSSHPPRNGTRFTESIEAIAGITTGISAHDRARTVQVAIDPHATYRDLARPGHTFPLRACDGGVLVRCGHTEAAVDLARLAGLNPSGVICEIMNDDGTMARAPELRAFCIQHDLCLLQIADLVTYRLRNEEVVCRSAEDTISTASGEFKIIRYSPKVANVNAHAASALHQTHGHFALTLGDVRDTTIGDPCLLRIHSNCVSGNVLGSSACDCHALLQGAMQRIAVAGRGAILYLANDRSSLLPDALVHRREEPAAFLDPSRVAVLHRLQIAGQMLRDLEIHHVHLLTATTATVAPLHRIGIQIVEQTSLLVPQAEHSVA